MNVTPWLNWFWFRLKVLSKLLILRGKDKSNRNVFLLGLVAASLSLSLSFSYTCLSHVQFFYFSLTLVHFASFYLFLPLNSIPLFLVPCSFILLSVSSVFFFFFHYACLIAARFCFNLWIAWSFFHIWTMSAFSHAVSSPALALSHPHHPLS